SAVGPLDRTLGFAFGVERALVLASVAYLVVVNLTQEPEDPTWMREAKTLPIVRAGAEIVFDLLPENLRSPEAMDRLQAQGSAVLDGARAVEELAPVVAPALVPGNAPSTTPAPGPQGALGTQDRTETGYTQDQVNDINSLVGRVGAGTSK
ncbi:MAG: CvpA family protein, partial [Zavarzinia sp.]|nr:CvpA family protein [Zavarzinia sp.]